jgi:hypothetical protein
VSAKEPDTTRLSAREINKVQPPPEGLFPVPFHPGAPKPGSWIWGGMFLEWNDGEKSLTEGQNDFIIE